MAFLVSPLKTNETFFKDGLKCMFPNRFNDKLLAIINWRQNAPDIFFMNVVCKISTIITNLML